MNGVIIDSMITMSDVARKASVSRSTVSHVLSESLGETVRIPDSTRQRVLEVARELGYRPNALARSVRSGKTRMIGYLVDEPRYEPYWTIMVGALEAADALCFTLKLLSVSGHTLADRVRQCTELRLGGIVARVAGDKSLLFEETNHAQIPVVTVDEGIPQPFGTRVSSDDAPGIVGALEHLRQLGHHKIGFISSGFPKLDPSARDPGDVGTARELLFRQAMAAGGLHLPAGYVTEETTMVFGCMTNVAIDSASAQAATNALLQHPAGRPTAILCWRDETALFAIRECHRQGLRVPEDISVVGFSDISAARLCELPLSTVKMPWEAIGHLAIQQLAQHIEEAFDPMPTTHLVPTTFIARATSGPAPR